MRFQLVLSLFVCGVSLPAGNAAFICCSPGGDQGDECQEGLPACHGFTEVVDSIGACDLVLLHAPGFADGLGLDIHVRTADQQGYALIEHAAVRIGEDIFEVGSWGDYFLNGLHEATLPALLNDSFQVSLRVVNEKVKRFVIESKNNDNKEKVVVTTMKNLVSVNVYSDKASETPTGLMVGSRRKGRAEEDLNHNFAEDWQVLDTEPKLFQSIVEPQYPQKCKLSDKKQKMQSRRLGKAFPTPETARAACSYWDDIESCVYGLLVTNDLDLATDNLY